jgi:hypothetical protein
MDTQGLAKATNNEDESKNACSDAIPGRASLFSQAFYVFFFLILSLEISKLYIYIYIYIYKLKLQEIIILKELIRNISAIILKRV